MSFKEMIDYLFNKENEGKSEENISLNLDGLSDDEKTEIESQTSSKNNENKPLLKSHNVVKKIILTSVIVSTVVTAIGGAILFTHLFGRDNAIGDDQQITVNVNNSSFTQDEVKQMAKVALQNVEKELLKNDATPVANLDGDFYPEWFNEDMLTTIALLESTYRATEEDGKPLYGERVVMEDGSIQRARGMCQLLPLAVEDINIWLRDTMGSDKVYTEKDCDDPIKSLEMASLLLIKNCKNYFKEGKEIYNSLDLKNNPEMQRDLTVASYHYGGNVSVAYYDGTLLDTYLNPNWRDNENKII